MDTSINGLTPAQAALIIADGAFRVNHDIGSVAKTVQEGTDESGTPGMWIRVYNGWLYVTLDFFTYVQKWGPVAMTNERRRIIADTFKPDTVAV